MWERDSNPCVLCGAEDFVGRYFPNQDEICDVRLDKSEC